jgi:hypothetical protein
MILEPFIHDKLVSFDEDHHNGKQDTLVIKHEQYVPDDHIAALKRDKIDTLHTPTGDFYRVASIPVSLVELWKTQGFDIHTEPAQAILARLRKHDLDAFITTRKRI